jgi:hypothetical protein
VIPRQIDRAGGMRLPVRLSGRSMGKITNRKSNNS